MEKEETKPNKEDKKEDKIEQPLATALIKTFCVTCKSNRLNMIGIINNFYLCICNDCGEHLYYAFNITSPEIKIQQPKKQGRNYLG